MKKAGSGFKGAASCGLGTGSTGSGGGGTNSSNNMVGGVSGPMAGSGGPPPGNAAANKTSPLFGHQLKRPHSSAQAHQAHPHPHPHHPHHHPHPHAQQPPIKRPKLAYLKDMSAAEAGKYATLAEYAFFDKVRLFCSVSNMF